MKFYRKIIQIKIVIFLLAGIILFSSCNNQVKTGMLIITGAPGNMNSQDYSSGVSLNYLRGGRISAFNPGIIFITQSTYEGFLLSMFT